jgi:ATP-dependent RNA helicase DDX46/PRP5
VHRVGRTGRAGKEGVSYTFCNSVDEEKYAPIVVRALIEAGHGNNISSDLRKVSDEFKLKVEKGEARYAGSGFHGKGYSYDSSELSEAQKLAREEKRQALIEAGMLDPDDDDAGIGANGETYDFMEDVDKQVGVSEEKKTVEHTTSSNLAGVNVGKISADLLALPGMKEAIMKKAGYEIPDASVKTSSGDHFMEEIEINDYPREARWKVTQKDTTSRLQDEFQIAVTLKGKYYDSKTQPPEGERKLYLHVEATSHRILQTGMQEIRRLLNEETLRVGTKGIGGHRYSVL